MTTKVGGTRTCLYATVEDYALWLSVETHVFETLLLGHAECERTIKNTKIGICIGFIISQYFMWTSFTFLTIMIGLLLLLLGQVSKYIQKEYSQALREELARELWMMKSVLRRVTNENIETVEVHSSPWVNTRYLLLKK
jgi:hypothetical protein